MIYFVAIVYCLVSASGMGLLGYMLYLGLNENIKPSGSK